MKWKDFKKQVDQKLSKIGCDENVYISYIDVNCIDEKNVHVQVNQRRAGHVSIQVWG